VVANDFRHAQVISLMRTSITKREKEIDMDDKSVLLERDGAIGIITLNLPEQRNALSTQFVSDILKGLHEMENNPEVSVIIIRSAVSTVFGAGADLAEHLSCKDDVMRHREIFDQASRLWITIPKMGKIVIAMVDGYALAGGCVLAAACDLVITAESAVFGLPEINVGIFPMTASAVLVRCIGLKKCLELSATGNRINALEAEKMGLVNKVVPPEKLEETTLALARKIASKSRSSLKVGKRALYELADMGYANAISYGREVVSMLASTPDGQEGMAAFLEKREPRWKN